MQQRWPECGADAGYELGHRFHHGPSVTATVSVAGHCNWLEVSKFDINVYRQYAQKVEKVFTHRKILAVVP